MNSSRPPLIKNDDHIFYRLITKTSFVMLLIFIIIVAFFGYIAYKYYASKSNQFYEQEKYSKNNQANISDNKEKIEGNFKYFEKKWILFKIKLKNLLKI